jgi:ABC-type sugar transport system permease subunit
MKKALFTASALLAFVTLAGALSSELIVVSLLDSIRGVRVMLEARRALDTNQRPGGVLTIVAQKESAKYPFLNKRRYVVNTSSAAREGTALRGTDPLDRERASRHAEVQRGGVVKERLEGGAWRVTLSGKTAANESASVELTHSPPPIDPRSPWAGAIISLGAGLLVLILLHRRTSMLRAVCASLAVSAALSVYFAEVGLDAASSLASSYLQEESPGAPFVHLDRVLVRAALGGLIALDLGLVGLLFSERGKRFVRSVSKEIYAYASIAPAMLGLVVLVGAPFLFGIGLSFFEHDNGRFAFVGLENYARVIAPTDRPLFAPGSMLYALFINVAWTVSNVFCHVAIGLGLALLLQKRSAKLSRFYRVILILPWAVPAYLTALIWKSMFDPDIGAVNRFLGLEGMSWMHSAGTAFLANLITNVWLGFSFMMVVCLGALTSIPKDLYEAADVDGATGVQQFFRITLPLLEPALLPAVILGSIWTFNRFEIIYLVSEGRPDGATDILVTEAYRWAFERGLAQGGAYGIAAAYSVMIFLVLVVYGWMTSRVARAAEEALR